jgi:cobalt-zinc-cadmium resistance protein CzcA
MFVILTPQREWRTAETRDALIEQSSSARFAEAGPGRRPRVYATDRDALQRIDRGHRAQISPSKSLGLTSTCLRKKPSLVARTLETDARCSADVKVEQVAGLPLLRVIVDREQIARYGLTARRGAHARSNHHEPGRVVGTVVARPTALRSGRPTGRAMPNSKILPHLGALLHPHRCTENSSLLSRVAAIRSGFTGPAQSQREHVQRRIVVECNIRGSDLGGFVNGGAAVQWRVRSSRSRRVTNSRGAGSFEHLHRRVEPPGDQSCPHAPPDPGCPVSHLRGDASRATDFSQCSPGPVRWSSWPSGYAACH